MSSVFSVQDEPPPFLREGGQYKYSKSFKEMVESCLAKDPAIRPSAMELLDTPFFRSAKKKGHLVGAILKNLPPLTKRQERRKLNSVRGTLSEVPSWDFSSNPVSLIPGSSNYTTILSPTRSRSRAPSSNDVAEPEEEESSDPPMQTERSSSPESSIIESSSSPTTPDTELKLLPVVRSTSFTSPMESSPLKTVRPQVQTASSSGSSSSGSNSNNYGRPPSAFRHQQRPQHPHQHRSHHHRPRSAHSPQSSTPTSSELPPTQSSMFAPLSRIISGGSSSGHSSVGHKTGVWKKLTKGIHRKRTQDEG